MGAKQNSNSIVTKIFSLILNCGFYTLVLLSRWLFFNYNFRKLKKRSNISKVDVLFSSVILSWRRYIHRNGKTYDYDLMIGDVIEEVEKHFTTFCLDRINKIRPISLTHKKFEQDDKWICLEEFMTRSNIFRSVKYYAKSQLGYNNDPDIDRFFKITNRKPSINGYLYLIMAEDIISEFDPKIVFMTCEHCYFHRELTYVARLMGKNTMALQHGEISYPISTGYFFDDNSIRTALPDITCVFGREYFRILTEKSIFNPHMLTITGNPRYDILNYVNKIYSKEELIHKYNINPKKRIVLWTTQTHSLPDDENRKSIKTVYSAFSSIPNAQLIIKLHPGEDQHHPLFNEDDSYKPIYIGGKEDTYNLIYLSDVVITRHSTTGLEAVVMKKSLIVLNLSGKPDPINYVNEGVALGVYKPSELKPAIEKLLENESVLKENRKKYIEKYLYRMDGKSTERVVKVIRDVLKEKKMLHKEKC